MAAFTGLRLGEISTHAPVRGATSLLILVKLVNHISTHAPVRGATKVTKRSGTGKLFQPTLLCEERP